MKHIVLDASKERIPTIGFGMGKGIGYGAKTAKYDKNDERLISVGMDLGMTFFDVACDYGSGQAEETLGRALKGSRQKAFIATKFPPQLRSSEEIIRSAEQSLERLKTDRIDLFQTHWPNPQLAIEETLGAMHTLVCDGKVRYFGMSNCTIHEAKAAQTTIPSLGVSTIQQEYNLLDRTAELNYIPFCNDHGMTFIGYSPLAYSRKGKMGARFAKLKELAEKYSLSVSQLTLAWLTREERVMVLAQTSNERHLIENAKAGDVTLSLEDIQAISTIFGNKIKKIPAAHMYIKADISQKVYTTKEEAHENRYALSPSPDELAEQIRAGEILKPIKICADSDSNGSDRYQVVEGKLRYWAWVIAHGKDVLIPSVHND
jgi:aryl-alcohol dehydrogenase-like predicted oxidoreductase